MMNILLEIDYGAEPHNGFRSDGLAGNSDSVGKLGRSTGNFFDLWSSFEFGWCHKRPGQGTIEFQKTKQLTQFKKSDKSLGHQGKTMT